MLRIKFNTGQKYVYKNIAHARIADLIYTLVTHFYSKQGSECPSISYDTVSSDPLVTDLESTTRGLCIIRPNPQTHKSWQEAISGVTLLATQRGNIMDISTYLNSMVTEDEREGVFDELCLQVKRFALIRKHLPRRAWTGIITCRDSATLIKDSFENIERRSICYKAAGLPQSYFFRNGKFTHAVRDVASEKTLRNVSSCSTQ